MKEIEIINAFGTTNTCRTLDEKISVLEQEKIQKLKALSLESWKKLDAWKKENEHSFASTTMFEQAKMKKWDELHKQELASVKPEQDAIDKLKAEKKQKQDAYVKMVQDNECWNDLVHRRIAPKILEHLEKNGAKTEVQLVDELIGHPIDNVYSRYCYPLFDMEKLNWIEREGSGTVGDQRLCKITELGKKQLQSFRTSKKFDPTLNFIA